MWLPLFQSKAMTKVYSYPGLTAGIITIPVGRTAIKIEFSKGYFDKKLRKPALYSTSDKVEQQIIENSPLFGKRIFLYRTYGQPEEVVEERKVQTPADAPSQTPADAPSQTPAVKETTEYPEVTTYEDAIAVLKGIDGVKATQLRSRVSAKSVAEVHGIIFPNFEF